MAVPVRACDVGGWTDTWFAGHGAVCSLAVEPGVTVSARGAPGDGRVVISLPAYGTTFAVEEAPPEHGLVAAAVHEAGILAVADVELEVLAHVPPASSFGTSAAVCVGIIAALDALRGDVRSPADLAAAAHRAEADRLGRQSGVQDQVAAATGGANHLEMAPYPHVVTRPIRLAAATGAALDDRLVHVTYGDAHDSSAVHEEVIASLAHEGPAAPRLERLRVLAGAAARALDAGDLDAYAAVLRASTEAQAALHPGLVAPAAVELIEAARALGATGWKVNGAGGSGGSISLLCRDAAGAASVRRTAGDLGHRPLALTLARHGARVV